LVGKQFNKSSTIDSVVVKVDGILLYEHKLEQVDKVHNLLIGIHRQTDLTKLPIDSEIESEYEAKEVPTNSSYEEVKKIRDNRKLELFKNAFEGTNATGISDEDLEKWMNEETGLSKRGTEERTAFDNG